MLTETDNFNNGIVLFMHIPKTAGTTLDTIIKRQYRINNIINLNSDNIDIEFINENLLPLLQKEIKEKPSAKAVVGHFRYGLHETFKDSDCSYIAFLRNPVDQYISQYDYASRLEEFPDIKIKVNNNDGINGFMNSEISYFASNMQTYFLSGAGSRKELINNPKICLEKAKENLNRNFLFFGFQEHFDESLMQLKNKLNWKNHLFYKEQKVRNKNKLKQENIDREVLNRIKEINYLDIELYEFAYELSNKKFNRNQLSKLNIQKFRFLNSIYNLMK